MRSPKFREKREGEIFLKIGDLQKRWNRKMSGCMIFWNPGVQDWHMLVRQRGLFLPPFYLSPFHPFWSLVQPLVNKNLSDHLLLSYNKLLSFTSPNYWWRNTCYFNCFFVQKRYGLLDVAYLLLATNTTS